MKKLLSILASVGLVATASTAVVACTTTISAKNVTVKEDGDNYVASWNETIRFVKNSKYNIVKDGKKTAIHFMPYKLHLVADTVANTSNDATPMDFLPVWNKDGKTYTENPNLTFEVDDSSWIQTSGKKQNVWDESATKDKGYKDSDGNVYKCSGILSADQTLKTTVTIKFPKKAFDSNTLSLLLVRVEPNIDSRYGNKAGKYTDVNTKITIDKPASSNK